MNKYVILFEENKYFDYTIDSFILKDIDNNFFKDLILCYYFQGNLKGQHFLIYIKNFINKFWNIEDIEHISVKYVDNNHLLDMPLKDFPAMYYISSFSIFFKNNKRILKFKNILKVSGFTYGPVEKILYISDKNALYVLLYNYVYNAYLTQYTLNLLKKNELNSPINIINNILKINKKNNDIYFLKKNKNIISINQFISKYFFIIKKLYKLNLVSEDYKLYSHIFNLKLKITKEDNVMYKKEYKQLNLNQNMIINKIKNMSEIEKKNCITNIPVYLEKKEDIFFTLYQDTFFKDFFRGGRKEIFKVSSFTIEKNNINDTKKVYIFDMPSAYYNIMREQFFLGEPIIVNEEYLKTNKIFSDEEKKIKLLFTPNTYINIKDIIYINDLFIYSCDVYWDPNIPSLTVLGIKHDLGYIFPTGKFSGMWSGKEIKLFLKRGGIVVKIKYVCMWLGKPKHYLNSIHNFFNNIEINNNNKQYIKKLKVYGFGNLGKLPPRIIDTNYYITEDALRIKSHISNNMSYERNIILGGIITSYCRYELYCMYEFFYKFNIDILAVNTDSISVAMTDYEYQKILNVNVDNLNIKDTLKKFEIYDLLMYVNNNTVIYKKNNNFFCNTIGIIEEKEVINLYYTLKKNNINEFFFKNDATSVLLNTYQGRKFNNKLLLYEPWHLEEF